MAETFRVRENVTGLTMPDGRKLDSDSRGRIEVPDRYVKHVVGSGAAAEGHVSRARTTFTNVAGKTCGCGTEIFKWQDQCRACAGGEES